MNEDSIGPTRIFVGYALIKGRHLNQYLTALLLISFDTRSMQSECYHDVIMGSDDKNRSNGWQHDEGYFGHEHRDGSQVQYPKARIYHQSSRLGHHRIQDNRCLVQKSNYRKNLAPRRADQPVLSNRPNNHFLVKSKHLKEYLLTSLRCHIERIQEWLPDDCGYRGDDSDDGCQRLEGKEDMDWQLEPEIVIQGHVWSSEVFSASPSKEELEIATPERDHENHCLVAGT